MRSFCIFYFFILLSCNLPEPSTTIWFNDESMVLVKEKNMITAFMTNELFTTEQIYELGDDGKFCIQNTQLLDIAKPQNCILSIEGGNKIKLIRGDSVMKRVQPIAENFRDITGEISKFLWDSLSIRVFHPEFDSMIYQNVFTSQKHGKFRNENHPFDLSQEVYFMCNAKCPLMVIPHDMENMEITINRSGEEPHTIKGNDLGYLYRSIRALMK
jgi:hypothetical protein